MRFRIYRSQQEPGFRLSLADLAIGVAMVTTSYVLVGTTAWELAPLPIHAYLTFFCFCNIFRIGRKQEVVWWVVAFLVLEFRLWTGAPPYPFTVMSLYRPQRRVSCGRR
jgi:hypothetical protein